MLLKDLPKEELPRERLIAYGPNSLSNEELLAIIFRTGTKGESVKDISRKVLSSVKDIRSLEELTFNKLNDIKGLGPTKSVTLLACLELGRRVYKDTEPIKKTKILNPCDAWRQFGSLISAKKQENFLVLFLDCHRRCISHKILFVGTLNQSIVHPREVFKAAILENARGIILMHNHPSGVAKPSLNDDYVTKLFCDCGNMMGIQVLDHIVVGENEYYSYVEEGVIIKDEED